MRDWSNLLSKVQKMSYEEIVAKGKEIVDDVLESVEALGGKSWHFQAHNMALWSTFLCREHIDQWS